MEVIRISEERVFHRHLYFFFFFFFPSAIDHTYATFISPCFDLPSTGKQRSLKTTLFKNALDCGEMVVLCGESVVNILSLSLSWLMTSLWVFGHFMFNNTLETFITPSYYMITLNLLQYTLIRFIVVTSDWSVTNFVQNLGVGLLFICEWWLRLHGQQ